MAKSTNKSATKQKKTRGRQSDFSGEKLAYLDSLAKDFPNRKDRSAFYNEAAQGLVDKFGYSRDGRVYVEGDTLTADERFEYYQALRNKLGQWFRHRYLAKSSDRTYAAEIVDSIKSAASLQPRKRSAVSMYMEKNKEKLTSEFAIHWAAVQDDLSQKKRLPKYTEFVQTRWKKELQNYRDKMEKDVQEEHDKAIREWKEKIETFNGTPEDFKRAWGMAESVLPSFADGFADWLGAHIIIVAVSPNSSNGEITVQSVQSDCSKGHMKTLLPQFDENGWKKLQEMVITYGNAFFSPEECKRRIVKTDDDGPDVEMGATVSDDSIDVDERKDDDDADGESDPDVPGDAHGLGVEKDTEGTDPKDINRPFGSTPIADDGPGAMMEKAGPCVQNVQTPHVQVHDDKSSAETANTYATTGTGGNPPSPGLSGLSPAALTTDIDGGNPLSTGPSPTPTMEINGENANPFKPADTYAITEINGGNRPSPGPSPTAPTMGINGENANPFKSADTDAITEINGGNRPSPVLPGPSPTALTTGINGGNPLSTGPSPTLTMEINGENANPFKPADTYAIAEINGGNRPSPGPSPTAPTMGINGENANPFALQIFPLAGFNFPMETNGINVPGSTFNPYSCDFSLTSNWSAFPAHSATPSLDPSMDFWFGNVEYNPSGLTFPQDTSAFPNLGSLYEQLDPSLVPSSTYALPGPLVKHGQPMLGPLGDPSHSLRAPIIQPVPAAFASSQHVPLEPRGAVSEFLDTLPTTADTIVQESATEGLNTSRGQKRKGDEDIGKPAKKACSKGTENETEVPGMSVTGRELGEGTAKSDEANERAGKPTLSGRVPLMPTRLAEAGYQGEKKGVRATGRKAQPTKKPKSKGNATKPASKGANMPTKKKVKKINSNQ